jgi:signal transduction histidine kinase
MPISSNLYTRLLVPLTALLIVAMVSAWWIASSLLSTTLERSLDDRLSQALAILDEGTFPLTQDLLDRLAALLNADLALFDGMGGLALSTLADESPAAPPNDLLERLQAEGVTAGLDVEGFRVMSRPLLRDRRFATVVAIASTRDMRAAAREAALWLGVLCATATVLLAAAAHFFVKSIVSPIARLSDMAGRIARGNRALEVRAERNDEIGALTFALNQMAKSLADYESELSQRTRLSALGEMSARIAHEIRNPLTSIKLKLQMLGETARNEEVEEIRSVLREIERLELIVTSALSTARLQRIAPVPADANRIIEDVVSLVMLQLRHQGVMLECRSQPLPRALLDDAAIKQVLFNLINNAAAAMPDGGRLMIATSVSADGASIRLDVEDSGPGIPDDERPVVFQRRSGSSGFRLGLGLNLCQELVEQHGGAISVGRSRELGGAHFVIALPICAA